MSLPTPYLIEAVEPDQTLVAIKFLARCGDEEMWVTPHRSGFIDGGMRVLERGANGTTPAEHPSGSAVLYWDASAEEWIV